MSKKKMWAGVLAVFLTGLIIGAVGSQLVMRYAIKAGLERFRSGNSDLISAKIIERMGRSLDLTPEQKQKIRPIVKESLEEMFALRREMNPRLRQIKQKVLERLRPLLTPEQQEKLNTEMARRPFLPPPPPPPPP